jgi:glutathione synthase/RimK-type ligase-like ATP-grasp enzyme
MKIFVYPYNQGSKSAGLLAKELNTRRLKRVGSKVKDTDDIAVVNWGSGDCPFKKARVLNKPSKVSVSSNKLKTFEVLKEHGEVRIPPFTTDINEAKRWITDLKYKVAVRSLLNANGGKGLAIAETVEQLTKAPLYVRYVPKAAEFRVHVVDGVVIRCQKKVMPKGKVPDGPWAIRNHENGFIFQLAKGGDVPDKQIFTQAVLACDVLGLDFGGVDVIWNEASKKAYVLEVNTAPGIEGGTVTAYATALKDMIRA